MLELIRATVGSTAYGLNRATSDIDTLAVFIHPTQDFWGLTSPTDSVVTTMPDVARHELAKYLRLTLACNPTLVELLWLPEDCYRVVTDGGRELIEMRGAFLWEKGVRNAFGGYAMQQVQRLQRRNEEGNPSFSSDTAKRTPKHARHCFRLLRQGRSLLETGSLDVRIADPEEYWLFDDMPVPAIVAKFEEENAGFMECPTVLPEQPDRDRVDSFLRDMRRRHL